MHIAPLFPSRFPHTCAIAAIVLDFVCERVSDWQQRKLIRYKVYSSRSMYVLKTRALEFKRKEINWENEEKKRREKENE